MNRKTAPKKSTPFATASLVTGLSVAERGLGFLYRIVLSRLLGAEGVGLYQVALSVFSVFLTIGTGGIPITVSRLISKSKAENDLKGEARAVGAGALLCVLLTLPAVLLFVLFPKSVAFLFSDARCVPVFRILMLGLILSALYAVVRGSFWGNKKFLLPSLLELAEESVMVIAGVLLLQNVTAVHDGANRAAWAVVISYLFSFTASTLCFFFQGGKLSAPKTAFKPLFNATLPITSVRASGSLVNSAVAVLLPAMLIRTGASESDALRLFGILSGMAIPVLFIPSTVVGSLALVLVPELSEDFYRHNEKRLHKNILRGLTVAFLVACFLIPFFYALGDELGLLAFAEPLAGEFIRNGCVLLLPMSLTMISTAMLNSMGFEKQTFVFYFVGAAAMLLCVLLLPPLCGAYAYLIGLGASFLATAVCNLVLLGKKCKGIFRPFLSKKLHPALRALCTVPVLSLLGAIVTVLFSRVFGQFLALLLSALTLLLAVFLLWFVLGVFPRKKRQS